MVVKSEWFMLLWVVRWLYWGIIRYIGYWIKGDEVMVVVDIKCGDIFYVDLLLVVGFE